MSTTFHLRVWTRFLVPVEDAWRAKTDPAALAAELSPWAAFSFGDADALRRSVEGGPAATLDGSLRLGGLLPVKWPMQVGSGVPGRSYRTTSVNALFSRFEHDHLFEPTPDGCRYVDAITFVSTVPAQKATAILLKRLFEKRHAVAARGLPSDAEATGVSVLRVLVEDEDEQRKAG